MGFPQRDGKLGRADGALKPEGTSVLILLSDDTIGKLAGSHSQNYYSAIGISLS